MGLDSAIFLLFLGCVAVLQAILPARARVCWLICASIAFYACNAVTYLPLLLALCAINYFALVSLKKRTEDDRHRSLIFAAAIFANLAVLIAFKYAPGAVDQLSTHLGWPARPAGVARIAIPIGLSYFTFQMLACVTDAYRRAWDINHTPAQFVLFGFFFPQISSGPIPRAHSLLPQLVNGGLPAAEDRSAGARMIAYGFFKKFVVANSLGQYVNTIFAAPGSNPVPVFIACCFNALQLYADFSGYVDIAIGSARFLGIRLDPNFDRPFSSTSVTEFWRRWHMTLSFWLRDYLYMPLVIRIRALGKFGIALAMIITFAMCGIWHAATWPFLLFGVAQGIALAVELLIKPWRNRQLKRFPRNLVARTGNLYTLSFFVLTQVLFRSVDLAQARQVYSGLFHLHFSHHLSELLGAGPYIFAHYCVALAAWFVTAFVCDRATERSAPWFVLFCAVQILFLGALGSAHFIYAAF